MIMFFFVNTTAVINFYVGLIYKGKQFDLVVCFMLLFYNKLLLCYFILCTGKQGMGQKSKSQ